MLGSRLVKAVDHQAEEEAAQLPAEDLAAEARQLCRDLDALPARQIDGARA
jgi:hypothetical protein